MPGGIWPAIARRLGFSRDDGADDDGA